MTIDESDMCSPVLCFAASDSSARQRTPVRVVQASRFVQALFDAVSARDGLRPLAPPPPRNETVVPGQTVSPADVQIVSIQHPQRPVLWMKLYHAKVYGNIHGARGGGRLLR